MQRTVRVPSRFSHVWLFVNPWTVARQAPVSMGFFRQEYYSGLPFPSPGEIFPTQGSNLGLLHFKPLERICSSLLFTGGQDQIISLASWTKAFQQAEGQRPLRQAIKYDYNNNSKEKKSKKQFQHGVRIVSSLQQSMAFLWVPLVYSVQHPQGNSSQAAPL